MSINDYDVDFDNIDSFLSAIQGPLEVCRYFLSMFINVFSENVISRRRH